MKDGIENSWAPHPGFEPPPSAQQAGALPLDHQLPKKKSLFFPTTFPTSHTYIMLPTQLSRTFGKETFIKQLSKKKRETVMPSID